MDDGHARSQNKAADEEVFRARQDAWFDHYLKDEGATPASSATALTTVCGGASEGPFTAPSWRELSPGEVRFSSAPAQTVVPGSGDPSIGTAFDPIKNQVSGEGPCSTASGADQAGVATYRLPAVPAPGFTLLGSPTIVADLATTGTESELAARLLDVSPTGTERLVARGLLRPGGGATVFQLHPQAYRFTAGDVAKLELLPSDAPYARPSNAQAPITVSNLELRLPVREQPGSLGGVIQVPAPKVLPPGYELAAGYQETGGAATSTLGTVAGLTKLLSISGGQRAMRMRLRCTGAGNCSGRLAITARHGRRRVALARGRYSLAAGKRRLVRLPLSRGGRKLVTPVLARRARAARKLRVLVTLTDAGRPAALHLKRSVRLR
jgi:hypothetical protein